MGFLGKLFGGGGVPKEVIEEAHKSEIAAKKLLRLAKTVEAPLRKLEMRGYVELLSEKDRKKRLALIKHVGDPSKAKSLQDQAVKALAQYMKGFSDALMASFSEYAALNAQSKKELEPQLEKDLQQSRKHMKSMMDGAVWEIMKEQERREQEILKRFRAA